MDVVRTNIRRLAGEIDIDTAPGAGTRFTLRLPLTVSIADALMVRAGGQTFALPLTEVERVVDVLPDAVRRTEDGETVTVDGRTLPLVDLAETLGLVAAPHGLRVPVALVRARHRDFALAVDALLGKEEIVVNASEAPADGDALFSGSTIADNGHVVSILDLARCLRASRTRRQIIPTAPAVVAPPTTDLGRVLLVDDSVSVRRFLGQMLERAGFQVTLAGDGAQALESLAQRPVDLVVTDLEMPRVDGYELIRDLRGREATRDLPIVVVTSRPSARHSDAARELGVQHYITKPVDPGRLVPIVEELVHGEAAAR